MRRDLSGVGWHFADMDDEDIIDVLELQRLTRDVLEAADLLR
jgi:hypothetical protein